MVKTPGDSIMIDIIQPKSKVLFEASFVKIVIIASSGLEPIRGPYMPVQNFTPHLFGLHMHIVQFETQSSWLVSVQKILKFTVHESSIRSVFDGIITPLIT
jgi:hypothetical protein